MAEKIYNDFVASTDIITIPDELVTYGMWNGVGQITTFHTSSTQVANTGKYYFDIFTSTASAIVGTDPEFSISYGSFTSTGSTTTILKETKAIYSQYSGQLLNISDTTFTFNGINKDKVAIINLNRTRYKESVNLNGWELTLKSGSNTIKLIDSSTDSNSTSTAYDGNASAAIVSGSINTGSATTSIYTTGGNMVHYGLIFPTAGILVLDIEAINTALAGNINFTTDNLQTVLTKFLAYFTIGQSFVMRSQEYIKNTNYIARIKSTDFNYSTNPTWVNPQTGIINNKFIRTKRTYITTVGLYNREGDLVAVAKLSTPIMKAADRELTVKVLLNF